jgi:cobalt ECF transporter T component CbiQ
VSHSSFFIERTIQGLGHALSDALLSEQTARRRGLLQSIDPRVRVVGVIALIVAAVASRKIEAVAALFVIAILIALASRVTLLSLAKRVWLVILVFTGLIALPALFITPGRLLWTAPFLHLAISAEGCYSALLLILRVETTATLSATLVLSTQWTHILKALRSLRVPSEVVAMLAMTQRYIILLIETANQMFESRRSRTIGVLPGKERRKMVARTAGVLLSKSVELSQDVYLAMVSRGFRGEVRLLTDFRLGARDYAALATFVAIGSAAVWIGR